MKLLTWIKQALCQHIHVTTEEGCVTSGWHAGECWLNERCNKCGHVRGWTWFDGYAYMASLHKDQN